MSVAPSAKPMGNLRPRSQLVQLGARRRSAVCLAMRWVTKQARRLAAKMKRLPPAPLTIDTWPAHSRQHEDWRRHKEDAVSLLREGDGVDHFYDVFEREGVERLLARYEESPDGGVLKVLFGLLGARLAMRRIAPE